jgi:hypothetical protein
MIKQTVIALTLAVVPGAAPGREFERGDRFRNPTS